MYDRYVCPLQPCRHFTLKLLIQGHPWSAKVPHIADFKIAYISLLLVLGVCNVKPTYRKSCAVNLLMWSDLTLDPSFKVKHFIYLGFYVAFNTVQVISRWVVGSAEETSTYSLSGFCTVNCRPTASNYQLSHLRSCREPNPGLRGGR